MGWSSGSGLMGELITAVAKSSLDFDDRVTLYEQFIEAFEREDCDTLGECLSIDPAFDEAYEARDEDIDDDDDDATSD